MVALFGRGVVGGVVVSGVVDDVNVEDVAVSGVDSTDTFSGAAVFAGGSNDDGDCDTPFTTFVGTEFVVVTEGKSSLLEVLSPAATLFASSWMLE